MSIITDAIASSFEEDIKKINKEKDEAYSERNKLVALISKLFPSCLGRHEVSDLSWDKEWMNIVYVHLSTGQCSWHIHDSELSLFSHLNFDATIKWDGHSTEEKYDRIKNFDLKKITRME